MRNGSSISGRRWLGRTVQRGFTLIEIMVVVVIMGILAALVVPKLMGRADDARVTAARQDIASMMQALKLYKLDNQRYPTTEQGLQALVQKPTSGPATNGWKSGGYIEKLPKDPWGGQ
jgi:general secretion pathway protein G